MSSDTAVTPEELLRILLSSQSQPAVSSVKNTHPTRIRTLQALREERLDVLDLADRIDSSRQTVYRVLEPCIESGLVRPVETEYALSCSGGAILRMYQETFEAVGSDAMSQLARSKHQPWVLEALQMAPARKSALARKASQEGGPSRPTIHRIVDRLIDGGYVIQRSGTYELTESGQLLLETYTEFIETIAQALDKREFLRWLPADLDSFPVRALSRATLIQNSTTHPHNVLNALLRVADPNLETFEGMATIVSPTIAQAYRPVLSGNTRVTGVFPDEVLFGLHRDREFIDYVIQQGFRSYIREGIAATDVELLFVPDVPPIHLAIFDGTRTIISLTPSTGVTDTEASAIDSSDPEVVEWVAALFEECHMKGRPPLRAFLDRTPGFGSGSQRQVGD